MIISDTSVIANLISIEHLFLLQSLYKSVIIPQAVQNELGKCHPRLLTEIQSGEFSVLQVMKVTDPKKVEAWLMDTSTSNNVNSLPDNKVSREVSISQGGSTTTTG